MEMWKKATIRELIRRNAHSKIGVWYSNNNVFKERTLSIIKCGYCVYNFGDYLFITSRVSVVH